MPIKLPKLKVMKNLFILFIILLQFGAIAQGWEQVNVPTNNNLNSVFFIDKDHGWIVGDSGTILKYYYGNWETIESNHPNSNLNCVHFTDTTNGWIGGNEGLILRFLNDSLIEIPSPTTHDLFRMYVLSDTQGWAIDRAVSEPLILELTNNEWVNYPTSSFSWYMEDLLDIHFLDTTFGIICGDIGTILVFEGNEWYEYDYYDGLSDLISVFILDKENIFYYKRGNSGGAGTLPGGSFEKLNIITGEISYGVEFGHKWQGDLHILSENNGWAVLDDEIIKFNGEFSLYKNAGVYLNSIYFANENTGYIAGDEGRVYKFDPLALSLTDDKEYQNVQIYPNPIIDIVKVKAENSIDIIDLYDIVGRKIKSFQISGEKEATLDLKGLVKGVFFLKTSSAKNSSVTKVIKE